MYLGGAGDAVGLQKEYSLSQFKFVKDLGNGAFGIVQQVVNIESGELFAMKAGPQTPGIEALLFFVLSVIADAVRKSRPAEL